MMVRLLAVALLAWADPIPATDDGWAGQFVWPREPDLTLVDEEGVAVFDLDMVAQVLWAGREWVLVRHSTPPGPFEGYVRKGQLVRATDAEAYFTARIRAHPKHWWGYACRAQARVERGEFDGAIADLTEAIRVDPRAGHYVERGRVWAARDDSDRAIADLTEAIRLNPNDPAAFNNRGVERAVKKEYEAARKDYDEAIRLNPGYAKAYANRGNAWAAAGEYARAAADYSTAARLDPRLPAAFAGRAGVRSRLGEYQAAARDWEEAARLTPRPADELNSLAWLLATCPDDKIRDGKRAVELATRACELTGWKRCDDLDTLAAAYAEAGDFAKAVEYQRRALEDEHLKKDEASQGRLKLYQAGKAYRQDPPARK